MPKKKSYSLIRPANLSANCFEEKYKISYLQCTLLIHLILFFKHGITHESKKFIVNTASELKAIQESAANYSLQNSDYFYVFENFDGIPKKSLIENLASEDRFELNDLITRIIKMRNNEKYQGFRTEMMNNVYSKAKRSELTKSKFKHR